MTSGFPTDPVTLAMLREAALAGNRHLTAYLDFASGDSDRELVAAPSGLPVAVRRGIRWSHRDVIIALCDRIDELQATEAE